MTIRIKHGDFKKIFKWPHALIDLTQPIRFLNFNRPAFQNINQKNNSTNHIDDQILAQPSSLHGKDAI
jgi:hypothetical protein